MAKSIKQEELQKDNAPHMIDLELKLDSPIEPEPEIYGAKRHYQEWLVQITNGKAEKLKVTRECVKITEEQAEILNQGVTEGGNAIAKMYFLKEK